ncbi:MAG: hypothetical protein GX201_13515 [Clostridiales bacterium]|nr:hypothetical protein [Clostridiales bacterium]
MTTLLTHLRVAEKIKERIKDLDLDYFMAGFITPDSGGKEMTHFYKSKNQEKYIDVKCYYNRHLRPETLLHRSDKTRAFYWGYYFHLIVDNLWSEIYYKPIKKRYNCKEDFNFLFNQDMCILDFEYLEQNPENNIFLIFSSIDVNLEFFLDFPPALIYDNIKNIKAYYSNVDNKPKNNLQFLKEKDIEEFIITAVNESINAFYK